MTGIAPRFPANVTGVRTAGATNLFVWTDPTTGVVALVWAQSLPFQAYPLFGDARRAVEAAIER